MPRTWAGCSARRRSARARIGHRSQEPAKISYVAGQEERGGAAVDLVEIVPGFGVEKWYGPSTALEAAAAISSGPPNPCITPSTETLVVVVNLIRDHLAEQPPRAPSGSALLAKKSILRSACSLAASRSPRWNH